MGRSDKPFVSKQYESMTKKKHYRRRMTSKARRRYACKLCQEAN